MGTRGPHVTPGTCGTIGEEGGGPLGVGNAPHPYRLGVTRGRHQLCVAYGMQILECSRTP